MYKQTLIKFRIATEMVIITKIFSSDLAKKQIVSNPFQYHFFFQIIILKGKYNFISIMEKSKYQVSPYKITPSKKGYFYAPFYQSFKISKVKNSVLIYLDTVKFYTKV